MSDNIRRKVLDLQRKFSITQQQLAKKTGVTPGTIHHYESLIKTLAPSLKKNVMNKELTFKEARSIADIDDHDRQIDLAKYFYPVT